MHILIPDNDPLTELRTLQRDYRAGRISEVEFKRRYDAHERAHAAQLCANGDGRPAYQIERGRALCATCALLARNLRRRV